MKVGGQVAGGEVVGDGGGHVGQGGDAVGGAEFLFDVAQEQCHLFGAGKLAAGGDQVARMGGQAGAQGELLVGRERAALEAAADGAEDDLAAHGWAWRCWRA